MISIRTVTHRACRVPQKTSVSVLIAISVLWFRGTLRFCVCELFISEKSNQNSSKKKSYEIPAARPTQWISVTRCIAVCMRMTWCLDYFIWSPWIVPSKVIVIELEIQSRQQHCSDKPRGCRQPAWIGHLTEIDARIWCGMLEIIPPCFHRVYSCKGNKSWGNLNCYTFISFSRY